MNDQNLERYKKNMTEQFMQFIYHGRLIKFYDRIRELTDMHGQRYHIPSDRIFDHYVISHVVTDMAMYVQTNTTDDT